MLCQDHLTVSQSVRTQTKLMAQVCGFYLCDSLTPGKRGFNTPLSAKNRPITSDLTKPMVCGAAWIRHRILRVVPERDMHLITGYVARVYSRVRHATPCLRKQHSCWCADIQATFKMLHRLHAGNYSL